VTASVAGRGPTVDPESLSVLAACCRDGERARFGYRGRDGTSGRRDVEPHALVHLGRRWYLVGWDVHRRDWRTFRLDRLDRPAPGGVRFAPRELPAEDPAAFVSQGIAAAPSRYEARVTLRAPAQELAARRPWLAGALRPLDERTCEYRTGDDDLDWLAVRVGMLGVEFEVHEPPELVEHLRGLARRFRRATAGAERPRPDAA
jgi:predicted DNA-binding transcriptional regulator YafY